MHSSRGKRDLLNEEPRKVLIFLHHGLGDLICALPSLRALDEVLNSRDKVLVVVKSRNEGGVLDAVEWHGRITWLALGGNHYRSRVWLNLKTICSLIRFGPRYVIYAHAASTRLSSWLALLFPFATHALPGTSERRARRRNYVTQTHGEHKVSYYCRFLEASGLVEKGLAPTFPRLRYGPVEQKTSGSHLRIAIAPGVGTPSEQHKAWPPEHYAELVNLLKAQEASLEIVLTGAPAERALLEQIRDMTEHGACSRVQIVTPPTPAEASTFMKTVGCVVSSCSGAGHLAALAGTPVVGIFGPTSYAWTGPFTPALVPVVSRVPCAPCYRRGHESGCDEPTCMRIITPTSVSAAVRSVFALQAGN